MKQKDSLQRSKSAWVPYLVLFCACFGVLYPAFSRDIPVLLDNPVHIAQIRIILQELIPSYGWLCGWTNADFAGFDSLMYYGQAGFLLPVTLVKTFHFSVAYAYTLTLLASLFFTALGFFAMLRPHTGRFAAMTAALGFIALANVLSPLMGGMWNYYIALGFVFLFLADVFTRPHTRQRVPLRGFLLAAALWTHPYAIPVAAIFIAVYALRTRLSGFTGLVAPFALAAVGTLFYTWPIAASFSWLRPIAQPRNLDRALASLVRHLLFPFGTDSAAGLTVPILFIVSAVIYIVFARKRETQSTRRFLDTIVISLPLFVLAASGLAAQSGLPLLKALSLDGFRTMAPAQGCMLVMAAYLFRVPSFMNRETKASARLTRLAFVLCLGFSMALVANLASRGFGLLITSDEIEDYQYVDDLRVWMRENVDPAECRIMIQDTMGNSRNRYFSVSHILADTYALTGIQTVGAWSAGTLSANEALITTESGRFMGKAIGALSNTDIIVFVQRFNIGYIVCCGEELFRKLDNSGMFDIVFDNPEFIVFKIKPDFFVPTWILVGQETEVSLAPGSRPLPTRMDWIVKNPSPDRGIQLKFQNHPFWKADWNSNPVDMETTAMGNMLVYPPEAGESAKLSVTYTYRPGRYFWLCALGFALLSAACILPGRRKVEPSGPAESRPDSEQAAAGHENRAKARRKKKRKHKKPR